MTEQKPRMLLTCSRHMYQTPEYNAALARYSENFSIVETNNLFETLKERNLHFPVFLQAYDVCVIVYNGGFIGRGVYDEIWYLTTATNTPVLVFDGQEERALEFTLIVDKHDWSNYATISSALLLEKVNA